MAYFRITYESDTIEGLKSIQGNSSGQGSSAGHSTNSENTVAPPPQQDEQNSDAFSGSVPAPPAAIADANLDTNAFTPPPASGAEPTSMDTGMDEPAPPPPPDDGSDDSEGDNGEHGGSSGPPPSMSSKSPKPGKKDSK